MISRENLLEQQLREANKEIERLHSIIKEVREYIETHWACNEEEQVYLYELDDRKILLEILEKENI